MAISEEEFKKRLTPEEYEILRKKGTEKPFSGDFWNFSANGTYSCKACGAKLFNSESKFASQCGWPSFDQAIGAIKDSNNPESAVIFQDDSTLGMKRTEVMCKKCGSHLGHIFDDGPTETGARYCINSKCLNFHKK
ncbi:unnamed protein product [Gordionus sp. m RMFG-2023]|uniref:peptide methionine sulfoxide reductase MsrB-like n=1 Tax=Gordionus sp. m RMFG-2023 TaxID=3053472 RepID=UPI0030E24810